MNCEHAHMAFVLTLESAVRDTKNVPVFGLLRDAVCKFAPFSL